MKNSNFPGKDYFKKHPLKEFSAARFAYSQLLMPEVEDIALQMIRPVLTETFREVEEKAERQLKQTTLADCMEKMRIRIGEEQ